MAAEQKKVDQKVQVLNLDSFLGLFSLTRAERLFYTKTYGKVYKEQTIDDWSKETGLILV